MINNQTALSTTQNSLKFGSATTVSNNTYPVSGMTQKLASASDKFFSFADNVAGGEKLAASGPVMKRLRKIAAMFLDYDYKEVHTLGKRVKVVEPPIGALMLLLYPFTVGPRLYRAKQRDPSGVEFMDVIRRDMTAITIFLFLLKPLTNALNTVKQKWDGLKLVEKNTNKVSKGGDLIGKIFTYKQFDDYYHLSSANQLEAIVAEGNGKALENAVNRLHKNYMEVMDQFKGLNGEKETREALTKFKNTIGELVAEHKVLDKSGEALSNTKIQNKAQQAFTEMLETKTHYKVLAHEIEATAGNKGINKLGKMVGRLANLEEVLSKYAKGKRLPVDMLAFGLVVGAIGWFPVWFNDVLSRKRKTEEAAKLRASNAANTDPRQIWAALQQARLKAAQQTNPMQ